MTTNDLKGFALIPVVLIGCIFYKELANIIGIIFNLIITLVG